MQADTIRSNLTVLDRLLTRQSVPFVRHVSLSGHSSAILRSVVRPWRYWGHRRCLFDQGMVLLPLIIKHPYIVRRIDLHDCHNLCCILEVRLLHLFILLPARIYLLFRGTDSQSAIGARLLHLVCGCSVVWKGIFALLLGPATFVKCSNLVQFLTTNGSFLRFLFTADGTFIWKQITLSCGCMHIRYVFDRLRLLLFVELDVAFIRHLRLAWLFQLLLSSSSLPLYWSCTCLS